jgi:transcription antitermination factor NusG
MAKKAEITINHLDNEVERWFAVSTRFKSEKYACVMMGKKGIHSYLPIQTTSRKHGKKVRIYEKPVISCYVFVKIIKEQYITVLETENVLGFVKFSKNLISIPEEEIELLRRIAMDDELEVESTPIAFAEGDLVEITAGNLIGLKGKIIQQANQRKFQIEFEKMGQSILITMDAQFISKTGLVG